MKINLNTTTLEDFEALYATGLITAEDIERAKDVCPSDFDFDFWQLKIKDLESIMDGRIPEPIIEMFKFEGITVVEFFRREKSFEAFINNFSDLIEASTLKQTPEELRASEKVPKFMKHEGFLVFAREYFGLKSFSEAEDVTLADLFLAKKDVYAKRVFEREMNKVLKKGR